MNETVNCVKEPTLREMLNEQAELILNITELVYELVERFNGPMPQEDESVKQQSTFAILEQNHTNIRKLRSIAQNLAVLRNQL